MQQNYTSPKRKIRLSARDLWAAAILAVILLLGIDACKRNSECVHNREARRLYEESLSMISFYADSLKNAKDSVAFFRLRDDFEERLAKLNFQFPSDTDLQITEQENDSLYQAFQRYIALRDGKLEQLAMKNRRDTVGQDSLRILSDENHSPQP